MSAERPWYVRAAIGSGVLIVLLGLLTGYGAFFASPSKERFIITLLTNVIIVVGMQVYIGNSGIVSFGHLAFMGVGAYVAALASIPEALKAVALPDLPPFLGAAEFGPLLSIALAIATAGLVALAVGIVITRLSGGAGTIATLALLIVFYVVASNWTAVTGGVRAIYGVPRFDDPWLVFAIVAIAVVVGRAFRETTYGMRLRASADDPAAAGAVGVNIAQLRLGAWVLSAMVVGAGGSLFAMNLTSFGPTAFYLHPTFVLIAMLIIGGMGSVTGAVCGAVVVSILNEWLRGLEDGFTLAFIDMGPQPGVAPIALALAMLALLLVRGQGLLGRTEADEILAASGQYLRRWRHKANYGRPESVDG
jgi:ABC-type branched-subunit amino acid transport system permease subunit